MQKVRKVALVGIVPNHDFFRLIQQSVLPSLSVTQVRDFDAEGRTHDPAAKLEFTNACTGWS